MMEEKELTSQEAAIEREKAADEAAKVRYLDPGSFKVFEQGGAYRLTLPDERTFLKFSAFRTFPLTYPENYISLRDGMEEIGIIRDLGEFDRDTQRIIRELIARRYFVPRVTKIVYTKQRYGGMVWEVETDRGIKRLITKGIHEALSESSEGRFFITDVDGNRYEILIEQMSEEDASWIRGQV